MYTYVCKVLGLAAAAADFQKKKNSYACTYYIDEKKKQHVEHVLQTMWVTKAHSEHMEMDVMSRMKSMNNTNFLAL